LDGLKWISLKGNTSSIGCPPIEPLKCVMFYQKAEFKSLKVWCSYIFYAVEVPFNILKYQHMSLLRALAWFSLI